LGKYTKQCLDLLRRMPQLFYRTLEVLLLYDLQLHHMKYLRMIMNNMGRGEWSQFMFNVLFWYFLART